MVFTYQISTQREKFYKVPIKPAKTRNKTKIQNKKSLKPQNIRNPVLLSIHLQQTKPRNQNPNKKSKLKPQNIKTPELNPKKNRKNTLHCTHFEQKKKIKTLKKINRGEYLKMEHYQVKQISWCCSSLLIPALQV